jgi:predicted SnoaL-like aldol condensation-catalyzing enzyme
MSDSDHQKRAAVDFLQLVTSGEIEEAYRKHVDMRGKHHNVFTPAGMESLKAGMIGNESQFPNKKLEVRNALADGDRVAVHSRLQLGDMLLSVVHLFRFEGGKIVEMWDCAQAVPADSPNKDGAF